MGWDGSGKRSTKLTAHEPALPYGIRPRAQASRLSAAGMTTTTRIWRKPLRTP